MTIFAPEPLGERHRVEEFSCGAPTLDDWLKKRARANQVSGASRTYVLCETDRVVAYYALSSGSVALANATGRMRRNMPDPVPIVLLGRLAIDRGFQGRGLGRALAMDALRRIDAAADVIGIRGVLVHAISAEAQRFYLAIGFEASPLEPMTLMATLADIRAASG